MMIVIKPVRGISLGVLALVMCACTRVNGPVIIREVSEATQPGVANARAPIADEWVTPALSTTIVEPASPVDSPLQEKLLLQAQQQLEANQWASAIALAEQGLRIERRQPHFYRVLAMAYAGLSDRRQSAHFARQGLRYAVKGSDVYRHLQQWAQQAP